MAFMISFRDFTILSDFLCTNTLKFRFLLGNWNWKIMKIFVLKVHENQGVAPWKQNLILKRLGASSNMWTYPYFDSAHNWCMGRNVMWRSRRFSLVVTVRTCRWKQLPQQAYTRLHLEPTPQNRTVWVKDQFDNCNRNKQ